MSGLPIILVICLGSAILAVAGFSVSRKLMKPLDMNEHQQFLDAMFGIVGTLVSLILGLLVAAALDHYQNLEGVVDAEASGVAEIFRFSRGMPQPTRGKIQALCGHYVNLVVNEEWPAMAKGTVCPELLYTLLQLNDEIVKIHPQHDGESNLQAAMLQSLDTVATGRRERILTLYSSRTQLIGPMLIVGSLIVLAFSYFYVKRISMFHTVVLVGVIAALGGNLALVYWLGKPFEGHWRIQPRSFILKMLVIKELSEAGLVERAPKIEPPSKITIPIKNP